MATTTTDNSQGPQPVTEIPKGTRGGARPGAGKPPKAPSPALKVSPQPKALEEGSFWEYIEGLPAEAWGRTLICYLWRMGPLFDVGNGKPTSIAKLTQPFSVKFILESYGSGEYRFDVCEVPVSPKEKPHCLVRQRELVLDMNYPPKLPLGSWLDDGRNKQWEWCKPQLEVEEANRMNANQPQVQSPSESMNEMLEVQLKLKELSGGNGDGMAAILQAMLQNMDPAKQFAMLKQMQELTAPKASNGNESMMMIFQMFMEDKKAAREELREARAQQTAAVDPLASFKSFAAVLQDFGVNIGGTPAKSNPGDVITSTIGDIVGKVLDRGAEIAPAIVEAYKFGKQQELQLAAIQKQQPARDWAYRSDQAAAPASTPAAAAPAVAPVPEGPMTPQLLFAKHRELIQRVSPTLVDHFKNEDADYFREWLIDREGRNTWLSFQADATAEMLTQGTMMLAPGVFTPKEKVMEFFTEMLDEAGAEARDAEPEGESDNG